MKILLDENLPHKLRHHLPGHDVFTAAFMNYAGLKNGRLLKEAATAGFDVVVTLDSGLRYQQNLSDLPCAVLVLKCASNAFEHIEPLLPDVLSALRSIGSKALVVVGE